MFIKKNEQKRPRHTAGKPAEPATPLSIANLMATASFNTPMPISRLSSVLGGRSKTSGFRDWVVRLNAPKVTVQVFIKGNVSVIGAKRGDEALLAMHQIAACMRKNDIPAEITNFRIRNMVLCQTLGYKLDLEQLEYGCRLGCVYNPEVFPGIHIKQGKNGCHTVIAFHSGKLIVTGACDVAAAKAAIADINFIKYKQK
jgi:transcription initiation factor TFIID TATA-box-binding protein